MKKFKIEYIFVTILVIVSFLLFFRGNKITGYFSCSTTVPERVDKQTYDAYKSLIDSYTPIWNESDCYNLFGVGENGFDDEYYNQQLHQLRIKTRILETNTSREYNYVSGLMFYYFYDKFFLCSLSDSFSFDNFTPILFEQIKSDIQQEIDYKKIADLNCNNGNVSVVMWEQPNGALTVLWFYIFFPDNEFPTYSTIGQIVKLNLLVNGDKSAYFNFRILRFLQHYCNPNLPTKITFTE